MTSRMTKARNFSANSGSSLAADAISRRPGDLLRPSAGVRRHVVSCLQNSNLLGKPEALRQHVDDRGIYIVDTVPYVLKLGHGGATLDITHLMIRLFDLRHECS